MYMGYIRKPIRVANLGPHGLEQYDISCFGHVWGNSSFYQAPSQKCIFYRGTGVRAIIKNYQHASTTSTIFGHSAHRFTIRFAWVGIKLVTHVLWLHAGGIPGVPCLMIGSFLRLSSDRSSFYLENDMAPFRHLSTYMYLRGASGYRAPEGISGAWSSYIIRSTGVLIYSG